MPSGSLPGHTSRHVRDPGRRPPGLRVGRGMPAWSSRSRSAGIWPAPATSTACSTGCFRKSRSSASITSWARNPCRTCSCSGLPISFWNRCGAVTMCPACRSPWPSLSALMGAESSMKSWGPSEMWCKTTFCRSSPFWRWKLPEIPLPPPCRMRKPRCSRPSNRSIPATSCRPVRRVPKRTRRRSGFPG